MAEGELRGAEQARAGAGNLDLDRGHLLGVWGVYGEKKGRERTGWCSLRVTGYSVVYMCAEKGSGSCLSKINC